MNEKYKVYGTQSGKEKLLVTENHPNLTATEGQFGSAATAITGLTGYEVTRIDLSSDTTVFTVD